MWLKLLNLGSSDRVFVIRGIKNPTPVASAGDDLAVNERNIIVLDGYGNFERKDNR